MLVLARRIVRISPVLHIPRLGEPTTDVPRAAGTTSVAAAVWHQDVPVGHIAQ